MTKPPKSCYYKECIFVINARGDEVGFSALKFKTVLVTSFKGGVGKSTVTANISMMLAHLNYRVLALDCDFNMRCLDLIMGYENSVVYDICDILAGRISAERAILNDSRNKNLFFCAAPYNFKETIDASHFAATLSDIAGIFNLDYIIIDTPGDALSMLPLIAKISNRALIVATHQPASVRAAERTSVTLDELGITDRRLIINRFDASAVKKGTRPGIIDIIDRTYIQLIGVIPYDTALSELQERGALIDELDKTDIWTAFYNTATRLIGRSVPLFHDFKNTYKSVVLK